MEPVSILVSRLSDSHTVALWFRSLAWVTCTNPGVYYSQISESLPVLPYPISAFT